MPPAAKAPPLDYMVKPRRFRTQSLVEPSPRLDCVQYTRGLHSSRARQGPSVVPHMPGKGVSAAKGF